MKKAAAGQIVHTESGKVCTLCGEADVYTVESRAAKDYVRRTKVCSHCGHKFVTAECSMEDYKLMLEIVRFFDKYQMKVTG